MRFRLLSILLLVFLLAMARSTVHAGPDGTGQTPATHMWIMTGNALVFVPARSLEHCVMLTQQASNINSSTGECYNDSQFLKKIRCTKSTKSGTEAHCIQE